MPFHNLRLPDHKKVKKKRLSPYVRKMGLFRCNIIDKAHLQVWIATQLLKEANRLSLESKKQGGQLMPKGRPRILTEIITFQVSPSLNQQIRDQAWTERKGLGEFLRELVYEGLKLRGIGEPQIPAR